MKLAINKAMLRSLDAFIKRSEQKKKKKCYLGLDTAWFFHRHNNFKGLFK